MALAMSLVHKENLGTMSISLFVYLFIYLQCDREINQQGSGSPTASVRQAIWEVSQKFRHALVPLIIPHAHQPESIAHYGVEICLFLCFKFWEFYLAVKGQQMVFRCEFEWP